MNHHDEECELVAIKDRISLCAFCGDISHSYADCPDRYPNKGPKKVLPRKEGPGRAASHLTRKDSPEPPIYYGVCSFCGLVVSGYHADTPISIKAEPSIWPTAAFINIHEHPL